MDAKSLYDKKSATEFYESRYSRNYMNEWPLEKKQRVFKLLGDLPLPEYGSAVDFGCGNGVFTDVLKQALPKWEIFGCEISEVAINNAKKRLPDCNFFVSDDQVKNNRKFNFLFTHHVLEHVYNIENCVKEMNDMLLPGSFMFHIMP